MDKTGVKSDGFDLGGGEIRRIFRLAVLNKYLPMGNLGGGPGLRCLVTLFVIHQFGHILFRLIISQEERLTALYRRLKHE